MYWLVDVFVLLFLVLTIVGSIKAGFTGMLGVILSYAFRIIFVLAFTAGFLLLFQLFGAIDGLSVWLTGFVGNSDAFPTETVSSVLALVVFFFISLVLGFVVGFTVYKLLAKLLGKLRPKFFDSAVNKVIGCVLGVCLYVGVIACVFACVHAFATAGGMLAVDETLRANILSGFLYEVNPLNALFESAGFAPKLLDMFHGHF